jgi:hypothetical protein
MFVPGKLLAGSAMGAFSYWLNNIVEQNRVFVLEKL